MFGHQHCAADFMLPCAPRQRQGGLRLTVFSLLYSWGPDSESYDGQCCPGYF